MPQKMSSITHTPYGSEHWFNTLVSSQKAIAEILSGTVPTEDQTKQLAKSLYTTTEELIKGWKFVQEDIEDLKRIKLT
jgi:hypothetical protein